MNKITHYTKNVAFNYFKYNINKQYIANENKYKNNSYCISSSVATVCS